MTSVALPTPAVDGCWSTREACEAVGLPVENNGTSTLVHRLIDAGLLTPHAAKQGSGKPLRWRATDVADLAVAAEVRRIAGELDGRGHRWVELARLALRVWRSTGRRLGWIIVCPTEAHAGRSIRDVIERIRDGSGWLLLPAPTPPTGVEAWPPEPSTQAAPDGADSRPAPSGDRPFRFQLLRGSEARDVTVEERAALERVGDAIDALKAAFERDADITVGERLEYDDALRAADALGLTRHEIWRYGVEREQRGQA